MFFYIKILELILKILFIKNISDKRFINEHFRFKIMPKGMQKSRSLRRVKVKTPSNKVVIHYRPRKPGIVLCQECKKPVSGARWERAFKMKGRKSSKRPSRAYSSLCTKCSRRKIIGELRK